MKTSIAIPFTSFTWKADFPHSAQSHGDWVAIGSTSTNYRKITRQQRYCTATVGSEHAAQWTVRYPLSFRPRA